MKRSPLIAVSQANATYTAGFPGHCAIEVRLLDDISLRVHAGELLLVHSTEPIARTMLLSVLAGGDRSPPRRYLRVIRDVAPRLRIRRAAIHGQLVSEIVSGWQQVTTARDAVERADERMSPPTVYLLRASRTQPPAARDEREWRRWAQRARAHHDAIVIACAPPDPSGQAASGGHARHVPSTGNTRMCEATPHYATESTHARASADAIRRLEMRAGRLHDVRTPRHDHSRADARADARADSRTVHHARTALINTADRERHRW